MIASTFLFLAMQVAAAPVKRAQEGWMTYTYGGGALGACGKPMIDDENMIAIGWQTFDKYTVNGNSNLNTLCGQPITVTGATGTRTLYIWDSCGACGEFGIDVPPAAFNDIGGQSAVAAGRQWISWEFGGNAPSAPTTSAPSHPGLPEGYVAPQQGATCTHSSSPFNQANTGCSTGCCFNGHCSSCETCFGAAACASQGNNPSSSGPIQQSSPIQGGPPVPVQPQSSGGACSVGAMRCKGTGAFETCIAASGVWASQSCPPTLKCQSGGGGVVCGF
jgi:hypothetical protein